jgi:Ca-activated chloride channel family protein
MLSRHPLSARRHMLRRRLMDALRAEPGQRPPSLSRWLSTLIDSLSVVTERGLDRVAAEAAAEDKVAKTGRKRHLPAVAAGVALLSAAVLIAAYGWPTPTTPPIGLPACTRPTDELLIFASQDKATLLAGLGRDYGPRQFKGRCITIRVEARNSGKIMGQLTGGWKETDGPRPDVWSPASSTWFELTRHRARAGLLPAKADPLFTTPLVIGVPKPMAEAMGWPNVDIGWNDLAVLAQDRNGWGRYQHPEWGAFRLGKTNPNYSASGFTATIGAYFATTGRNDELTEADVDDPRAQGFVKSIERSVVHYGDTTLTFLANLRRADDQNAALSYISAVTLEESSLVAYNLGYPCGAASGAPECAKTSRPKTPLVAIYPEEGTLTSDHPYVKMPRLSEAKAAVADDFLRYVHSDQARDKIAAVGFRTFDGQQTEKLLPENGAVPTVTVRSLGRPQPKVLSRILEVWPKLRKPANVLVLVDTSGSMNRRVKNNGPTKIELVRQAADALVKPNGFGEADLVGLWRFSENLNGGTKDYQTLVPVARMSEDQRERIRRSMRQLTAKGGTALFNTIDAAVSEIHRTWDPNAINAVVVLSDGRNMADDGITNVEDLLPRILDAKKPIRVFTIAYGRQAVDEETHAANDADDEQGVLESISNETGARRYVAPDATTIGDILIDVISNF